MSVILDVTLPIELTNGNDGRGHAHWRSTSRRRKYEEQLRALMPERKPFDVPVSLTITRILGKGQRLWDADSVLRGSAKELIDSLVAVGWFHDDGPKWILSVDGRQDDSQRPNGPAVQITVHHDFP